MSEAFQTISGLLGGLAVFIFGMNMMSECLQKAAGEKMKTILGVLTRNPVMGMLAGALVTAVLQSSSATTVMVIGFVSAGLMTLPQAISVIFGANIGTTMTAQLMAFKIGDYIWMIVFIGFIMFFIGRGEKIKSIGQTIFAFGLLFVGIETMGAVMKPLATNPIFTNLIAKVSDIPMLGVLLGTVMTLVVQSSSATIAVLQSFASQPMADGVTSVIGLAGAIPILLGDNIGTTITALLASIGQSKNAKRTAVAHSVFNIAGCFLFIWFIPIFAEFVKFISPKGNEVDVIARQIANAHMSFNMINTLIWLPLIPLMVKIVTTIVRGEDKTAEEKNQPLYIDTHVLSQPAVALHLAKQEVMTLAENIKGLFGDVKVCFVEGNTDVLKRVDENGNWLCRVHEETVKYMSSLFSGGGLTEEQTTEAADLMFAVNVVDKMRDRCMDIAQIAKEKIFEEYQFSQEAIFELQRCFEYVEEMMKDAETLLTEKDGQKAWALLEKRDKLRKMQRKFNKNHIKRMKQNNCKPELTGAFSGILQNLDRIGVSCINVAEEVLEEE